jgi:hypothetical protein
VEQDGRRPAGRFTRLVSPTFVALSFVLLMALCRRQDRRMDGAVLPGPVASFLEGAFGAAAMFSAMVAGVVGLWLLLRPKSAADLLAGFINFVTAGMGLCSLVMVA